MRTPPPGQVALSARLTGEDKVMLSSFNSTMCCLIDILLIFY